MMGLLHRQELREHGFTIVKNVIPRVDLETFESACKHVFDNQLQLCGEEAGSTLFESMKCLYSVDYDRYARTASSLWRITECSDIFSSEKLREEIRSTLGTESLFHPGGMVVHVMATELKFKGGYFGFPAHQDYPSIGGSLDGIVVWIPIYDVDENRYPVEIIPGSHEQGMWKSEKVENSNAIMSELYSEEDFMAVCCKSGDAVLMSNFLVHRSSINGDSRLRLAVSNRYCNGEESTFIQRCYPTAYKRVVERLDDAEVEEIMQMRGE